MFKSWRPYCFQEVFICNIEIYQLNYQMKFSSFIILFAVIILGISCDNSCVKYTADTGPYGNQDLIVKRQYANCADTLNYYEWRLKSDSAEVSSGEVKAGLREGQWTNHSWNRKTVSTYESGVETLIFTYSSKDVLIEKLELQADSLYKGTAYYDNGNVESEYFQNSDGFLTGNGADYHKDGWKVAEGQYIPELCFADTVYIENPNPPHDLQMTIVEELGGRHGLWKLFDSEGNQIGSINYDHGIPVEQ